MILFVRYFEFLKYFYSTFFKKNIIKHYFFGIFLSTSILQYKMVPEKRHPENTYRFAKPAPKKFKTDEHQH